MSQFWTWLPGIFGAEGSPPGAPGNLLGTFSGAGQIAWTWDSVPDAIEYQLRWGTVDGGPYPNTVDTGVALLALVGGLAVGTYYAVVVAINAIGNSVESSQASCVVPVGPSGSGLPVIVSALAQQGVL